MTALNQQGHEARFLALRSDRDEPNVIGPKTPAAKALAMARGPLDKLPLRRYRNLSGLFSPAWLRDSVAKKIEELAPEVVHLGWTCGGFVRIESMPKIQRPTVWTLQDMWPFTGGCHVAGECTRYEVGCGQCPILGSDRMNDLSRKVFRRKERAWRHWGAQMVAPSRWIAESAKKTTLFQDRDIDVIPWCLDLDTFSPIDKPLARSILNLPSDHDIIAFGSVAATSDPNKGYDLLLAALKRLRETQGGRPILLAVFGSAGAKGASELPFPVRFMGTLHDDLSLRFLYSAADITAVPSRQESFGQTATESMACGTPVVAFGATGLLDIVGHGEDGYLAKPYDPEDFAHGLQQVLRSKSESGASSAELPRYAELCAAARQSAQRKFAPDYVGGRYQAAFERAVEESRRQQR